MAKEYAKSFYRSKAWLTCRDGYISSVNGLCEECLSKGRYKPGYIVHHIKHITPDNINDPQITLNWENLLFCCIGCHNHLHYGESEPTVNGLRFDLHGDIVMELGEDNHGE